MKEHSRWYSDRIQRDIDVVRWGHFGTPVLLFPTAGGDAFEAERFRLIDALGPLLSAGRIKVFACDNLAGRTWLDRGCSTEHRTWFQNQFDSFVYHELVPMIRHDCRSNDIKIVTAGASLGAFEAIAALCRHPDAFRQAICMSGTYDLENYTGGWVNPDFYFSSPMHFLPNLQEGQQLNDLRNAFVLLAYGEGRWESPEQTWRMSEVLGSRGIPNWVEVWGPEWDHDWPTWRAMLPHFLDKFC